MPPKSTSPAKQQARKAAAKGPPPAIRAYLIAYNIVSFFLWTMILSTLLKHLILGPQTSSYVLHRVSTFMEPLRPYRKYFIKSYKHLPAPVAKLLVKASTTHSHIGGLVAFVQSLAVLEIVHAALGWVRSPVPTTAIQVASRLWSVWGVTEQYESSATTPFYATMILAWSVTEVIRYAFYANQLLGGNPKGLLWLR
jgi:very-long-chain (3R)-3-hydroxyacyl-CoA dehydratase